MFQNQLRPFCSFFDLKIKAGPYLHATAAHSPNASAVFFMHERDDEPPILPIAPLVKM